VERVIKNTFRVFSNLCGRHKIDSKFLFGQSAILSSRANSMHFKNLWDAEVKIYSQFGEDGILDFLCEKINLSKPKIFEIGAGNFQECNSRWLAENRNASVFAVDGREDLDEKIINSELRWKNHLFSKQIWVTPDNIQSLLIEATDAMGNIDIFSIDLDGNDYWILEKTPLDDVKICILEYNPLFGSSLEVTVPRDDQFNRSTKHFSWLYFGASLKAYISLMSSKGFTFVGTNRVGNNAFFLKNELSNRIQLEPIVDLSPYTDWRIRESRSKNGGLSFLSGNERIAAIMDEQLLDLQSEQITNVGDCI
jgi:hypothetical protein